MKNIDSKLKTVNATMLCIIAFTVGLICAFTGCATTFRMETTTKSLTPGYETLSNDNYITTSH
jgi:hypothetical protein